MKTLLWKLSFAIRFSYRLRVPLSFGWQTAEATVESFGIDDQTPAQAVEDEIDAWRQLQ